VSSRKNFLISYILVGILITSIISFPFSPYFVSAESIHFDGSSPIEYQIFNGSFDFFNIACVDDDCELLFAISPSGEGKLVVSLPRELIDSKLSDVDIGFNVRVMTHNADQFDVDYEEISSNETHRILSIKFPNDTVEIQISGTYTKTDVMIIMDDELENYDFETSPEKINILKELGIKYTINNAVVSDIQKTENESVLFLIKTLNSGELYFSFPDDYSLSTFQKKNDIFVLVDAEDVGYDITASPPNTIIITFPDGTEEIEIIYEMEIKSSNIPDWIRNNAKWWSGGQIGDSDFTSGIQYMIKENIMVIPDLPEEVTQMELKDEKRAMGMEREQNVPDWVRNNAGWWADGLISDDDFVSGIKYLVEQGIIRV